MEIARREAEEAEAQEDAANEDVAIAEENLPEPEPEAIAAAEFDMEAVEKENVRHMNALAKIMGGQVEQLLPCATCSTWPFPGFEPFSALPGLRDAQDAEACEACNAHGLVRSGSLHPDFQTKSCIFCQGKGYRDVAMQEQAPVSPLPYAPSAPVEPWPEHYMPFVPIGGGSPDSWNRPAGHPRWGLEPLAVLTGVS